MSKDTCILYPEAPNGESSRMYQDLLKRLQDRPLANLIYAIYKVKGAEGMENAGIAKNNQGEHSMDDVLNFIDFKSWEKDIANLSQAALHLGAIDSNGRSVDFTNAEEALRKADDFNKNHTGLTAKVVQHGDIYNIAVVEKNANTHDYGDEVSDTLKIWDIYKQTFNDKGVDITALPKELDSVFNALDTGLGQYLKNLSRGEVPNLYRRDAMILLSLSPNIPQVERAVKEFGSIEDVAQALDDFNHGAIKLSVPQQHLIRMAISEAKKYQGIDMDALITQVKGVKVDTYANSPEEDIKDMLRSLYKKYKINVNEIHRTSSKIKTFSDAAAEAAMTIYRQIRQLEKEKGNNVEGRRLETMLNKLMKELECKKYYSGLLSFLDEANTQVANMDAMLQSIPQTGTEVEKAFATAKVLQDIKSLKAQYYTLVSALANENITIDESISKTDIDNIRQLANKVKGFFDAKENMVDDLTESTMTNLMVEIVGDKTPNGISMVNAIRMAAVDSSYFDYLYSVGKASNPIIGAMGSIIRNAQDSRDEAMNEISFKIRVATNKLYKAGHNSEFMYEDDGHIASDIDWALYETARKAKIKSLAVQGFKGFDFKQALEDWEEQNTEERIVDKKNGRTERVPNKDYRKPVDFQRDWTDAQKEYYDTMMQLKGEIGSLLPAYAQKQYLPPQIRRELVDALKDSKDYKDVLKALKNKFKNLYTVREDDENYGRNGIIDGEEYSMAEGNFENEPLKQIPIFFVNKVEKGELLKNFSTGIAALAGTAVNYKAMDDVVQVVEFMGDFAKNQAAKAPGNLKESFTKGNLVGIVKDLWRAGNKNCNTNDIVTSFIAQHIYGQHRGEFDSEHQILSKLASSLIGYTSFKGLATNVKGAFANYIMGEFQMMIEAGAGEFYGWKDYAWAHSKLFGNAGAYGEIMELMTNNIKHKGVLFREMFDPLQENFSDKSHKKYYRSPFRQLLGHDCSFIGYTSGEYFIHYVNMYSLLHHQKVMLDGKKISLYDAFEVSEEEEGNTRLKLKEGVTDLDGNPITSDYIDKIRKKLRYVNQSTHGAMNDEDKGLIHRNMLGRLALNFRQWMVGHVSRRARLSYYDSDLGETREGYWISYFKHIIFNDEVYDNWKHGKQGKVIGEVVGETLMAFMPWFLRDYAKFMLRSQASWNNLSDMQKYNIKRVNAEMQMLLCLVGIGFVLGDPEDHKKEYWRRWWIYQTKRMILDTESSMPHPKMFSNWLTIMNSPMAGLNTVNSLLYLIYGVMNGDFLEEIKSGDHKGENRYLRNVLKTLVPGVKDIEQMQKLDSDDAIFKVFEDTPTNH